MKQRAYHTERAHATTDERTVLILMADMGGGHRSAAEALAEAAPDVPGAPPLKIHIVDGLREHTPFPLSHVHVTYRPMVEKSAWLWRALWDYSSDHRRMEQVQAFFAPIVRKRALELFDIYQPDLVVSVYTLMNHIPYQLLKQTRPHVPFATVVTDLVTVHHAWVNPAVDLFAVPTEMARAEAVRVGMPTAKVQVMGLPVSRRFRERHRRSIELYSDQRPDGVRGQLRRALGVEPHLPLVLLMSGGEGMGPVTATARTIAQTLHRQQIPAQLAIICGRNVSLQQTLRRMAWPLPVSIQGFVKNIPDWMEAADLVVTKAGPGTISEAFIMGRPVALSSYVPGQEEGNIPLVTETGAGIYEPEPERLAARLGDWLRPGNPALQQMAARSAAQGRPHAAPDTMAALLALLPERVMA